MISILADKNIPFLADFLPEKYQVYYFDPDLGISNGLSSNDLESIQAILVRTVTKINAENLQIDLFPNLKFLGTASAGVDHVDTDFLRNQRIAFSNAAGCNANAVGEYVISGILHWCLSKNIELNSLTIGIIGVGKTGSSVRDKLVGFGCNCVEYDPPKAIRESDFTSHTIEELWSCDVLTFHVPLTFTNQSELPTYLWLNEQNLSKFRGNLIINASRGEVVDENALLNWKSNSHKLNDFIIDVWNSEPDLNVKLAGEAWIATPHIAGYSNQAKLNATRMIVSELVSYFDVESVHDENSLMSNQKSDSKSVSGTIAALTEPSSDIKDEITALEHIHPMFLLSRTLKNGLTHDSQTNRSLFRTLRTHSTLRDEYATLSQDQIDLMHQFSTIYQLLNLSKGSF